MTQLATRTWTRRPSLHQASGPIPWAVAAGLLGAGGFGLAALSCLVVALASSFSTARAGIVENLPAAFVMLCFGGTGAALLAGYLGIDLYGSTVLVRSGLTLAGAALATRAWRLRGRRASPGGTPGSSRAGSAPGLVLVALGVVTLLIPVPRRVEWFLGGDNVRNVVGIGREWADGALVYGPTSGQPRAWHTMVTIAWSASGQTLDGKGLAALIPIMATSLWFAFALLVLVVGAVAVRTGQRVGLGPWGSGTAGLVAGCVVMWPTFMGNYLVFGFETAILCAVFLMTGVLELTLRPGSRLSVAVTCSAVAMVAHAWPPLLPAAGVGALAALVVFLRKGSGEGRVASAVTWVGLGAIVSWPSVHALFVEVGFERASIQGVPAPSNGWWFYATMVAAGAALLIRREWQVRVMAVISLGTALSALVIAAAAEVPVDHYYPRKILWQAMVTGVPLMSVVAALGGRRLLSSSSSVRAPLHVAVGSFAALSFVFPVLAFTGPWSKVDGYVVLDAAVSPEAGKAQVVWVGTPMEDTVTRILLDFYRARERPSPTIQYRASVEEECVLLAAGRRPIVLTTHAAPSVAERYRCAPDVVILPVARR